MTVNIRGSSTNRLAVAHIIARESLYRLKNHLVVPRLISHKFEGYFDAKLGDRFTIKKPYRAVVRDGATMAANSELPLVDRLVDYVVNFRKHVPFKFNATEMTLDLTNFYDRYFGAGIEELAYSYDIAAANELMQSTFYYNGTPGTAIDLKSAQYVRAHAEKVAIPERSTNCALLDPYDVAELSEDLQGLGTADELVTAGIRRKFKGMLSDWNVFQSVHTDHFEVADYGASVGSVNSAGGYVGDMLPTDGWPASTKILNKGQIITIANVNEVQPRGDRRVTGNVAAWVVTKDVTSSAGGAAVIPVYPEINDGTLQVTSGDGSTMITLEAFKTCDVKPADNAMITVVGTKGQTYRQGIFFDKEVAECASIGVITPESAGWKGSEHDEETGLAVSVTGDFTITSLTETKRADVMAAIKGVYPELGVRFISDEL